MRILALDMGDVWVGSAISDPLGVTCKPYKTVKREVLVNFTYETISLENVTTIVTGVPYTMSGKEGSQANKTNLYLSALQEALKKKGIGQRITWETWDERKTSKYAQLTLQTKAKAHRNSKVQGHSIAAAFILQGYLDHKATRENYD